MSWKNVKLIFHREVRDQLRDRRTLFMVAILPLLLYPGLGIGMVQMTALFEEQPRTVVILGADQLPAMPQLLEKDRFASSWFTLPSEARTLNVITDGQTEAGEPAPEQSQLIEQANRVREIHENHAILEEQKKTAVAANSPDEIQNLELEINEMNRDLSEVFAACKFEVLIVFPDGFAESIERESRAIAEQRGELLVIEETPRPIVIHNNANKKSQLAYRRVNSALRSWEQEILRDRLRRAKLPEDLSTPVNPESVDLANEKEISDSVWSMLFPALLVIMAVTGAFYPAVDLAAGEKERGTMETLLICPAKRSEIVLGKFFTVMLFSLSTALLNMASMGFTGKYMISIAGGAMSNVGDLSFPSPLALVWVGVLLIPLAALFSALCLALATFARSSKEGQYYLTPLLMVTMGLTVFCLSPAVEITPFYSMMPVVGPALLLKELIASPGSVEPLLYAIPVLITSLIYSLLALWWAIEQFAREDVLFREAERLDLGLWMRHLMRDKQVTPSFAEAGFCFVVVMLLQFAAMKVLQDAVLTTTDTTQLIRLQMIYLVATVATPALLMAVLLTKSMRETLRLHLPKPSLLAVALILPFTLHPLAIELMSRLEWFFPKLPEGTVKILQSMTDENIPLWLTLLALAVTPAICEEITFRGFILSGFSRSKRVWLAIILSSLAFGIVHRIPQQVFNASLLGIVLGLIVVRSNSLLPAILFHLVYNSLQILVSRVDAERLIDTPAEWFITLEQIEDKTLFHYSWPTLLIAAFVTIMLLRWLVNHQSETSTTLNAGTQPPVSGEPADSEMSGTPPLHVG